MKVPFLITALIPLSLSVYASDYGKALDTDALVKARGKGDQDYSQFVELGRLSGTLNFCGLTQEAARVGFFNVPLVDVFLDKNPVQNETAERAKAIQTVHASYIVGMAEGASHAIKHQLEETVTSETLKQGLCSKARDKYQEIDKLFKKAR